MRIRFIKALVVLALTTSLYACYDTTTQDDKDRLSTQAQQAQYSHNQPVPAYNWSLERHLIIELYNIRNVEAATHSVWRSDYGLIEGDCASMGFGLPYDTSLTNPLKRATRSFGASVIEQTEPNGVFASKNTAATWVMCVGETGKIEPVYVETKVTVYPYPVKVSYSKNKVTRNGSSSVSITSKRPIKAAPVPDLDVSSEFDPSNVDLTKLD